jgi:hypothetical protein
MVGINPLAIDMTVTSTGEGSACPCHLEKNDAHDGVTEKQEQKHRNTGT